VPDILVRPAIVSDAAVIARIYNQGIRSRMATFETEERTPEERELWLRRHDPRYPVLVAEAGDGCIAGWTAADPYRSRSCYAGVAEFSVYVDEAFRQQGIGTSLLDGLIEASEASGLWKLVSRIFVENVASRSLCARAGFREVGIYERHAKLDDAWRDVVIVDRLIEANLT
jgi:phosphinothricin acetyltransferase